MRLLNWLQTGSKNFLIENISPSVMAPASNKPSQEAAKSAPDQPIDDGAATALEQAVREASLDDETPTETSPIEVKIDPPQDDPLAGLHPQYTLDSTQQHYLKKELISMEIMREFNKLSPTYNDITGLRRLGPPFTDPDNVDAKLTGPQMKQVFDKEFPLIRFVLTNFIETFPFIKMRLKKLGADPDDPNEFWDKLQELYESWKTKKISNSNDRGEISRRKLVLYKVQSLLTMLFNSAVRCTGDGEYFEGNQGKHRNAYKKLSKLMGVASKVEAKKQKSGIKDSLKEDIRTGLDDLEADDDNFIEGLDINVVAVTQMRTVSLMDKELSHYEFLIHVKEEETGSDWYIRRRYTEFVLFHAKLKERYPGAKMSSLPPKDKSSLVFNVNGYSVQRDSTSIETNSDDDNEEETASPDIDRMERGFLSALTLSKAEDDHASILDGDAKVRFPRENMRASLRGYLRSLCSSDEIRESAEFDRFLSSRRITPTSEEMQDAIGREQLDHLVELQHIKFQQETVHAIEKIEDSISQLKEQVMKKGVKYILAEIKDHDTIDQLSEPVRALIQLAELEIASTQYQLFLGTDSARDTFNSARKIHKWFPYKLVAYVMRYTNPFNVMRRLVDIFTYQMPHMFHEGHRPSLLQTMFTGILADDVKKFDRDIDKVRSKFQLRVEAIKKAKSQVGDKLAEYDYNEILDQIDDYFNQDDQVVTEIKKEAEFFDMDLLLSILIRSHGVTTRIPKVILSDLIDDYHTNAETDKNSLYHLVKQYFKLQLKKLDHIMLIELWEEPQMVDLIKEMMSVFFEPLISLFKKAEIHKYVPIIKDYLDDVIKLVEYYQHDYAKFSQTNVVATFMELQNKYAPYAYQFLHNLYLNDLGSKNSDQVFDSMANWVDSFMNVINFAKEHKSKIRLDMNDLLNSTIEQGYDREKIVDTVNKIVDEVQRKKKVYTEIGKDSATKIKQFEQHARSAKVNANWGKINDRLAELATSVADDGSHTGIADSLGLDLEDFNGTENIDQLEATIDEKMSPEQKAALQAKKKRAITNFKTGQEFLDAYLKTVNSGELESNDEFRRLQEWDDTLYQEDLGLLLDAFKTKVYEILQEYKQYKSVQGADA